MRSSSELFTARLEGAEVHGDLAEDIYLLKPDNSQDPSVEIAITRLSPARKQYEESIDHDRTPIVLVHGSFTNRRFWLSPKGWGLSAYLVKQGFDVWMPEMRGHGLSPQNNDYRSNSVYHYAKYDLPAINSFIYEQTGHSPHWLGHSLGGLTIAASLAAGWLKQDQVASAVLMACQVSKAHWAIKLPMINGICRLWFARKRFLSPKGLNNGTEMEPSGIVTEHLYWHRLFGGWKAKDGTDYWNGLKSVKIPVMGIGSDGDKGDPSRYCELLFNHFASSKTRYICLSGRNEKSRLFGHVDMVVSREAEKEVWPLISRWVSDLDKVA